MELAAFRSRQRIAETDSYEPIDYEDWSSDDRLSAVLSNQLNSLPNHRIEAAGRTGIEVARKHKLITTAVATIAGCYFVSRSLQS